MTSFEFRSETDRELAEDCTIAKKIYDQGKPPTENIVELKKEIKSAWANIRKETLNKLVDSVPNKLIEVIRNKGKSIKYLAKT